MAGEAPVKSALEQELDKQLAVLKTSIMAIPDPEEEGEKDKKEILANWLKRWAAYIKYEPEFDPTRNIKYEPGNIVQVNFGYNVGSEQGGVRPAVVVEDNNRSSKVVVVVPLSSLKDGTSVEAAEAKGNVYLGVLNDYNKQFRQKKGTKSIALINQIRAVSKIRISTPTKKKDTVLSLDPSLLGKIYKELRERYTTKGIKADSADDTEN